MSKQDNNNAPFYAAWDAERFAPIEPRHQDVEIAKELLIEPAPERLDVPVKKPVLAMLALLLTLFSCNPEPPVNEVKVWATPSVNYGSQPAVYQFQLHFDQAVNSGATVQVSYTKNVKNIPGVYGAGQSFYIEESYQYNANGTTSQMVQTHEIGDTAVVSMCDFRIVAITGPYRFVIDNSMHPACYQP